MATGRIKTSATGSSTFRAKWRELRLMFANYSAKFTRLKISRIISSSTTFFFYLFFYFSQIKKNKKIEDPIPSCQLRSGGGDDFMMRKLFSHSFLFLNYRKETGGRGKEERRGARLESSFLFSILNISIWNQIERTFLSLWLPSFLSRRYSQTILTVHHPVPAKKKKKKNWTASDAREGEEKKKQKTKKLMAMRIKTGS